MARRRRRPKVRCVDDVVMMRLLKTNSVPVPPLHTTNKVIDLIVILFRTDSRDKLLNRFLSDLALTDRLNGLWKNLVVVLIKWKIRTLKIAA